MVPDSDGATTWVFDKDRHVKYWKRCLKTYLPSQYTSNDSNRMYLAYFMISAFELLDILDSSTTEEERAGYRDWIYHCQHPDGGFRMWPGTDFGERSNDENKKWDPAHIPATYFALTSLLTLGDDLAGVKRKKALQWLNTMQRPDGSFGETRIDGHIEGGNDPRFGYCAAGCRYILLNHGSQTDETNDINAQSLAQCIQRSQSYDGGLADTSYNEPHAGYTFCALGALALTDQLNNASQPSVDIDAVTRWLVDRQTDLVDPDGFSDSEFISKLSSTTSSNGSSTKSLYQSQEELAGIAATTSPPDKHAAAGMNGRLNKVADTCYCWWVSASLEMLGQGDLINKPALRRYLLQLTQHSFMGGFCKFPDDKYADIYHSFMGLAALSLASTPEEQQRDGIKAWNAEMCVSEDVRRQIRKAK